MFDHHHGSDRAHHPRSESRDSSSRRDLLELQLIQLRQEAFAARLEARAAKLELLLRRMSLEPSPEPQRDEPQQDEFQQDEFQQDDPPRAPSTVVPASSRIEKVLREIGELADQHFGDQRETISHLSTSPGSGAAGSGAPGSGAPGLQDEASPNQAAVEPKRRQVPVSASQVVPRSFSERVSITTASQESNAQTAARTLPSSSLKSVDRIKPSRREAKRRRVDKVARPSLDAPGLVADETETERRRRRPHAILMSAGLHLAILILLALVTLQTQLPRDQVLLTASPTDAKPESLETVTIETSETTPDPNQVEPQESPVEVRELSQATPVDVQLANSDFGAIDSKIASDVLSASATSIKIGDASSGPVTFCGVEGGGNHFVYLVDCSRSMGPAFESARRELIASIDQLKGDQRFYVIFFDADPDYMQLTPSGPPNRSSVLATPENKLALRQWAATIKMDRGAAPYEPLRFALGLRPDVIFLLSDGEFPAGIENLLREENHVSNLFGEERARSIVHTIGYHSEVGEARMRAIASQNQGQYRHVPKPGK